MRNSCTLKLASAVTFRRTSSKILPEKNRKNVGWGSNMQNIEESIREVYIPDGFSEPLTKKCLYWLKTWDLSVFTEEELVSLKCFLQTDQAGAEALIVAYDCVAADYRQIFIHGISPHVYVALKLFVDKWKAKIEQCNVNVTKDDIDTLCNTPIAELKLNPAWKELSLLIKSSDGWNESERYYYLAKQTVHSSNYGIMWFTFSMNILEKSGGKIVISRHDAEYFLNTIRSLFPEVVDRCRRIDSQVRNTGILYNIHGFPYIIWQGAPPEIAMSDMKKFYAWSPQSSVACISQKAVTSFQNYIEDNNKEWDFLSETHDSYLTQGLLHDTKERAMKMTEFMRQSFKSPIDGSEYTMGSETKIGFSWSDERPTNPVGLRPYKV